MKRQFRHTRRGYPPTCCWGGIHRSATAFYRIHPRLKKPWYSAKADKERGQGNQPKQYPFAVRADEISDNIKSLMGVHQFNDRHGPEQKNHDLGNIRQMLIHMEHNGFVMREHAHKIQGPAQDGNQKRRGRFIDTGFMFQRDGQIPRDKNKNDQPIKHFTDLPNEELNEAKGWLDLTRRFNSSSPQRAFG